MKYAICLWNNGYDELRYFDTEAEMNAFIESLTHGAWLKVRV